jgi:putative ABC transport system ATP-binding protein
VTPVLYVEGLRVTVGEGADTRLALEVPVLKLGRGECLAVTGPSGCGKSTLLEVLALLRRPGGVARFELRPEGGSAAVDLGRAGGAARLRRASIGYVPQSGGLLPFLTAREQIETPLRLCGVADDRAARERLKRLTQDLGLAGHLGKRRAQLSGGQRKRVSLLAGLSVPRHVLIADEPTAGLDQDAATRVLRTLAALAAQEGTVVIAATHDTHEARVAGFAMAAVTGSVLAYDALFPGGSAHG